MKVKDLKEILNGMNDEDSICFYIWDYEYDDEDPMEIGRGKFVGFDGDINLGVNI